MKLCFRCVPEDRFGPLARALEETQRILRKASEEVIEMRNSTDRAKIGITELTYLLIGMLLLLLLATIAKAERALQTTRASGGISQIQQPVYRDYRGVHLGMTAVEARAKLGEPAMKSD